MLPGVAGSDVGRPVVALPLVHREFDCLVRSVVRRVRLDLVRGVLASRSDGDHARAAAGNQAVRDAERGQCSVIARACTAVGSEVDDRERHGVGARRTQSLHDAKLIADLQQHETDARAHAFAHLLLDIGRHLVGVRLPEIRIHRDRSGQRAGRLVAFLSRLIELVARDARGARLRVGPRVRDALDRLIRIRIRREADSRVEPVQAVVRLQHRFAGSEQVIAQAETRREGVECCVRAFRKRRCRNAEPRRERIRKLLLIGRPRAIVIESDAEVERRAADGPLIGEERIVGRDLVDVQQLAVRTRENPADIGRRRCVELHLRGKAARVDRLADVAGRHLQIADVAHFIEPLAADFEVVRAAPTIFEVGNRAGNLAAMTIGLLLLIAVEVLIQLLVDDLGLRSVGVRDEREVIAEHAVARFRIELAAQRSVPLTFVDPAARILLVGRTDRCVLERVARQPIRLALLSPLVVADQLVVLIHLIRDLSRWIPQRGVKRRSGEVADEIRLLDVR